eukprot:GHVT01032748.1.p2 GENE.GHVT01032748.1~~GHVT01032748.1.p2  ORF type:complete len:161 (+),score=33.84 GHVT01032748.1:951-1433(+)
MPYRFMPALTPFTDVSAALPNLLYNFKFPSVGGSLFCNSPVFARLPPRANGHQSAAVVSCAQPTAVDWLGSEEAAGGAEGATAATADGGKPNSSQAATCCWGYRWRRSLAAGAAREEFEIRRAPSLSNLRVVVSSGKLCSLPLAIFSSVCFAGLFEDERA